jgi:hypothetical protein
MSLGIKTINLKQKYPHIAGIFLSSYPYIDLILSRNLLYSFRPSFVRVEGILILYPLKHMEKLFFHLELCIFGYWLVIGLEKDHDENI